MLDNFYKNKLSRISIKGFKSIKSMELDLKNLNVLIGANGAGKSNFVSFFRMLNFMIDKNDGLKNYVLEKGGANKLFHYGYECTQTINAELELTSVTGAKNSYCMTLSKSEGDTLFFTEEKVSYSRPQEIKAPLISLGGGHFDTMLNSIGADHRLFKTTNIIKNIMRRWRFYQFHDTSNDSFMKRYSSISDNKYLRDNAGNIASFLYMLRDEYPMVYKRIVMTIKQIAPFINEITLEPSYKGDSIILGWKEEGSNYEFLADQMSDGTLRAIALVTLLLQPNPPALICIDEPELGLHPFAINVLASLLKSASQNSQIIISTQSAALVNLFDLEDIIVVNRRNGTSEFKRFTTIEYEQWLKEYSISQLWEANIIGGKPSK